MRIDGKIAGRIVPPTVRFRLRQATYASALQNGLRSESSGGESYFRQNRYADDPLVTSQNQRSTVGQTVLPSASFPIHRKRQQHVTRHSAKLVVPRLDQNKTPCHRGSRRMELFRGNKLVYATTVAVGRPGMETPLGHFYVQARFHPDDPFLGSFAFETSAYSRLTDWPGGGVVGIHGTSRPGLLGQAVSHGCVRMSNTAALVLKRYVALGTPISIIA